VDVVDDDTSNARDVNTKSRDDDDDDTSDTKPRDDGIT
jgi:hypothetical protein